MDRFFRCALGLFLLASPAWSQQVGSVNLSNPPALAMPTETQGITRSPGGCQTQAISGAIADGVVIAADAKKPPAILVEIVRLSNETLSVGGEFQADIRLRNNGTEPILIPWSTDPGRVQTQDDTDASRREWEEGTFGVLLNGASLANRAGSLYGSRFSPGTLLSVRPGEWVMATTTFKLEDKFFPDRQLKLGKSKLSVDWSEALIEKRSMQGCDVASGYFRHVYAQNNPPITILVSKSR